MSREPESIHIHDLPLRAFAGIVVPEPDPLDLPQAASSGQQEGIVRPSGQDWTDLATQDMGLAAAVAADQGERDGGCGASTSPHPCHYSDVIAVVVEGVIVL